jgi:putative DNA primase/helicase
MDSLGVAEGIESAICAGLRYGVPTWAIMGTSGMASWLPPDGVTHVYVFGDNDRVFAGQAAAYGLGCRLLAVPKRRLIVDVMIPGHATTGSDWADHPVVAPLDLIAAQSV